MEGGGALALISGIIGLVAIFAKWFLGKRKTRRQRAEAIMAKTEGDINDTLINIYQERFGDVENTLNELGRDIDALRRMRDKGDPPKG